MFSRRILLLTLLTLSGMANLIGQNSVHVHGTVTNGNGSPLDSINILVSAIYSDSTGIFESTFTGGDGTYALDFAGPGPNFFGTVEVSMVDCFGTLVTQWFTVFNGPNDFQADFVYCQNIVIDSCAVYILEESNPGALNSLTAYTYANVPVQYAWSTGDSTQTIYPNQPGLYCVEVIFPWGCAGNDCYNYTIDTTNSCFSYISTVYVSNGTFYLEVYAYGLAPFIYQWSTGDSTSSIYNVVPGTYCVTTTDAVGCVSSSCVIVDDTNLCNVYIQADPNSVLTAYGFGEGTLSYLWSTGDSTQSINVWSTGVYCVTMTDTTGCSSSACYQFGIFPDSCYVYVVPIYTDSNSIALQAIPGIPGLNVTYLWNTGESGDIIYPQDPSINYCVTMTGDNGCVATACFENNQLCYAWVDVQYIDTNTAILTVYSDPFFWWPGSIPGTYQWSNGDSVSVITVHDNGLYCVTATLGPNCVTEACVDINFDSLQYACSSWVTQYQDPVTNQWYAQVYSWGYGTFSYLWSNGDTNYITPIATPNEYVCVTSTSSFGCVSEACVDTTFNPCQVYINIDYFNGGAVLYANSWYGDPANTGLYTWDNGQPGQILTVTEEGTYCVTYSSPQGCSSTACIDVYFGNSNLCGVYVSVEAVPAGTLYTANAWGVPPFTYLWSNGATGESFISDPVFLDMCVTVTDVTGCVAVGCSQMDTLNPNINVISGYVFADSLSHLKGEVYLYGLDANNGEPLALRDSTSTGDFGFYAFNNLESGVYLIKAVLVPGTVGSQQYIPSYHLSSTTWEEATPHVLPNWLPVTTDIWMRHVVPGSGSGGIGGAVTDPHHIIAGEDTEHRELSGLARVEVLLKNQAGEPLDFVMSDAEGNFRFSNLAYGTYRISYDIPGVHSPDIWVTLTAEDPDRLQISLIVNQGTTSVDQPEAQELSLYPNPAKNEINIIMPVSHATYDVQIVDMQGRVVYTGSVRSSNGILPVEVGQLSSGLFHINLKGENQYYYSRFLKLE